MSSKNPRATDLYDTIYLFINTTDIDDIEEHISYSLKGIVKCTILQYRVKIPSSVFWGTKL